MSFKISISCVCGFFVHGEGVHVLFDLEGWRKAAFSRSFSKAPSPFTFYIWVLIYVLVLGGHTLQNLDSTPCSASRDYSWQFSGDHMWWRNWTLVCHIPTILSYQPQDIFRFYFWEGWQYSAQGLLLAQCFGDYVMLGIELRVWVCKVCISALSVITWPFTFAIIVSVIIVTWWFHEQPVLCKLLWSLGWFYWTSRHLRKGSIHFGFGLFDTL